MFLKFVFSHNFANSVNSRTFELPKKALINNINAFLPINLIFVPIQSNYAYSKKNIFKRGVTFRLLCVYLQYVIHDQYFLWTSQ